MDSNGTRDTSGILSLAEALRNSRAFDSAIALLEAARYGIPRNWIYRFRSLVLGQMRKLVAAASVIESAACSVQADR